MFVFVFAFPFGFPFAFALLDKDKDAVAFGRSFSLGFEPLRPILINDQDFFGCLRVLGVLETRQHAWTASSSILSMRTILSWT